MASYKIVNASSKAVVIDLNGTGTAIRTLDIFPAQIDTYESVQVSPDVPGATMLKTQDGLLTWEIRLRIPAQASTANLITAINAVGNGFRNAANALMVQHDGEGTPRYYNIFPTTIDAAIQQKLDTTTFNVQKMVVAWQISPRTHPYPQGSSTPAWY
jgi:hypothetical protein